MDSSQGWREVTCRRLDSARHITAATLVAAFAIAPRLAHAHACKGVPLQEQPLPEICDGLENAPTGDGGTINKLDLRNLGPDECADPALMCVLNRAGVSAAIPNIMGRTIELPDNISLKLCRGITIRKPVTLNGNGATFRVQLASGVDPATSAAITFAPVFGSLATVRDLYIKNENSPPAAIGVNSSAHGVRLENLMIQGFEMGACVNGDSAVGQSVAQANSNSFKWRDLILVDNSTAAAIGGTDANASLAEGLEIQTGSPGVGLIALAFLGTTHVGHSLAGDPALTTGANFSTFLGCSLPSTATVHDGTDPTDGTVTVGGLLVERRPDHDRVGAGVSKLGFKDTLPNVTIHDEPLIELHIPSGVTGDHRSVLDFKVDPVLSTSNGQISSMATGHDHSVGFVWEGQSLGIEVDHPCQDAEEGLDGGTAPPVTLSPTCGNQIVEAAAGEECDKGSANGQPDSGCTSKCQFECETDDDCLDHDACTTGETCVTVTGGRDCVAGLRILRAFAIPAPQPTCCPNACQPGVVCLPSCCPNGCGPGGGCPSPPPACCPDSCSAGEVCPAMTEITLKGGLTASYTAVPNTLYWIRVKARDPAAFGPHTFFYNKRLVWNLTSFVHSDEYYWHFASKHELSGVNGADKLLFKHPLTWKASGVNAGRVTMGGDPFCSALQQCGP